MYLEDYSLSLLTIDTFLNKQVLTLAKPVPLGKAVIVSLYYNGTGVGHFSMGATKNTKFMRIRLQGREALLKKDVDSNSVYENDIRRVFIDHFPDLLEDNKVFKASKIIKELSRIPV